MKQEYRCHWIYRAFRRWNRGEKWRNWYLSFLWFVLPPGLLFLYPLISRFAKVGYEPARIAALFCAGLWCYAGPMLIYSFYEGYITFYHKLLDFSSKNDERIQDSFREIHRLNRKLLPAVTVLWIVLVLGVLIWYPQPLQDYGVFGYRDFWYWLFLAYVGFVLSQTAVGIADVLLTMKLMWTLLRDEEILRDVQDDQIGGYQYFGKFFLRTFLCFASGVLFIPILVHYTMHSGMPFGKSIPIAAMSLYTLVLSVSFLYPYWKLKHYAERSKREKLRTLEERYRKLLRSLYLRGEPGTSGAERNLELLALSDAIRYVKEIDTRPVSIFHLVHVAAVSISPFLIELLANLLPEYLFP